MAMQETATLSVVVVAATQFSCSDNINENISKAKHFVRQAASAGANIILLQELFATRYFCQEPCEEYFSLAISAKHMNQSFLSEFQSLAKEWVGIRATIFVCAFLYFLSERRTSREFFRTLQSSIL